MSCCRNFAAFLRVRPSDDTSTDLDPLDDMRVHPLGYQLAGNVARAALGQPFNEGLADQDEEEDQTAVDRALRERGKIEGLNLAVSGLSSPVRLRCSAYVMRYSGPKGAIYRSVVGCFGGKRVEGDVGF